MAFPYDPNATNQALSKLGSQYQLPGAMGSAAPAPVPQPTSVTVQTAPAAPAPAPTNDPGSPDPEKAKQPLMSAETAQAVSEGVQGLNVADAQQKKANAGMQKVGALVGTVLSAYTGNAAGVAGGVSAMKGAGK